MDKRLKLLLTTTTTTLLTLNIIIAIVYGATANAYPYHPQVKVYGVVTKPVYVGHEIWKYVADDGLTYSLPFGRQNKNITINFANIVFEDAFENKSVSLGDTTGTYAEVSLTKDVLVIDGVETIYLKITNSSSLDASEWYVGRVTLDVSEEPAVTNDYYLVVTMKVKKTGSNLADWRADVTFHFLDSGANERTIGFYIYGTGTGDRWVDTSTGVAMESLGHDNEWVTLQFKIQDALDARAKSWCLVKLVKVRYEVKFKTGTALDAESTAEAYIRHAFVTSSKVYVDDGSEDGLVVNGTSGNFPYSAGDIIQIYGANASKIVSLSIPFVYEDDRPIEERVTTIPQSYGFQYEWRFVMPKSPTETGDKFTYSSTNITLRCWYDGVFIKNLWVNGVDKTSAVSSKKTPTTEGLTDQERYWTYGLVSSLVGGNQYDIEMRVEDLPSDVWYALTQEPQKILTWSWFYDRILAIIQAILNILGLSITSIEVKRRELRVPKAS